MIFNALPRITIEFFKREAINIFVEKLMVTCGNTLENCQVCAYFIENLLGDIQ